MKDEQVLCVGRDDLMGVIGSIGAHRAESVSALRRISLLAFIKAVPRIEAELDTSLVQLVVYVVPKRLPKHVQLFGQYGTEKRLHGCSYLGAAGHVCEDDIDMNGDTMTLATFNNAAVRELKEEFTVARHGLCMPLVHVKWPTYVGMVYSNHKPVSSQHLILVYQTKLDILGSREPGIQMLLAPRSDIQMLEAGEAIKLDLTELMIGRMVGLL